MEKWKNKYRIPSARAKWWDYASDGSYFITICTENRTHFFGECKNGTMKLSTIGAIAQGFWYEIPKHFPFVSLGEFVVMPNHVHGILIIHNEKNEINDDCEDFAQKRFRNQGINTISSIVGSYKSVCTKHINLISKDFFGWQALFWDIIIRDDEAFNKISNYITNNPSTWEKDNLYSEQP